MTVIAGRYRLLDVLAEGATGTVWRALDESRMREVALKELRLPDGVPADDVPLLYARREREARAVARLSHPAVVTVHGVATEDGRPWVVMELLRGLTLAETLDAGGPLPPREAARVGLDVLGALRAAREAGVPHRGVTPNHVLIGNDGRVVVTGFGTDPGADPSDGGPRATPSAGGPGSGSAAPGGSTGPDLRSLGALLDAAAGRGTGPLGALIEELLGPEPPTADRVERELGQLSGRAARPTSPPPPGSGRGRGEGRNSRAGSPAREPADGPARGPGRGAGDGSGRGAGGGPGDRSGRGSGGRPGEGSGDGPRPAAARLRGSRTGAPRRGPVLVAGVVGALLIAGALAYHVVRDGGSGAGPERNGVTSTAPAGPGAPGTDGGPVTPRP
ncbi:serine/threonine-protein kinase [Streptomyces sp. NPDC056361]|uniref:serine/threonine-protein kinase n=1 Tax=Streptomyces sp. NPDC056361 TaxID=3345795 RepID=UPI0035E03C13